MSFETNTIISYIISIIITIVGFVMVFFTRNTLILAFGAILIIAALIFFLITQEKTRKIRTR